MDNLDVGLLVGGAEIDHVHWIFSFKVSGLKLFILATFN